MADTLKFGGFGGVTLDPETGILWRAAKPYWVSGFSATTETYDVYDEDGSGPVRTGVRLTIVHPDLEIEWSLQEEHPGRRHVERAVEFAETVNTMGQIDVSLYEQRQIEREQAEAQRKAAEIERRRAQAVQHREQQRSQAARARVTPVARRRALNQISRQTEPNGPLTADAAAEKIAMVKAATTVGELAAALDVDPLELRPTAAPAATSPTESRPGVLPLTAGFTTLLLAVCSFAWLALIAAPLIGWGAFQMSRASRFAQNPRLPAWLTKERLAIAIGVLATIITLLFGWLLGYLTRVTPAPAPSPTTSTTSTPEPSASAAEPSPSLTPGPSPTN